VPVADDVFGRLRWGQDVRHHNAALRPGNVNNDHLYACLGRILMGDR
jgi:hypothetical protein